MSDHDRGFPDDRVLPAPDPWIPVEVWAAAVDEPGVSIAEFMVRHALDEPALRELLREYRSETGIGAFQMFTFDHLDSDFINWHRWERLA